MCTVMGKEDKKLDRNSTNDEEKERETDRGTARSRAITFSSKNA